MNLGKIDFKKDIEAVHLVIAKAFSDTPDMNLDIWFSFSEMSKIILEGRGVCLKAISENKIVGMIFAKQESPVNGKEGLEKWVIVVIAVDPDMADKGVGSLLLAEVEKEAQDMGALKMFVYTNFDDERVIHFYKKNNYQDAGYIKDYQYGKDNSAVFLLKYLK